MKKSQGVINRHYQNFKDELIASGLVLVIASSGGFFLLSQVTPVPEEEVETTDSGEEQVLGVLSEGELVEEMVSALAPTPSPTPVATPVPVEMVITESGASATPSPAPKEAEYLVADDKEFENSQYILTLSNIRMYTKGDNVRSIRLEAVLANKNVTLGLTNRLSVSVVKDGKMIAAGVVMSVSESKTVKPGEKITFGASLSLIDGTDVESIIFQPTVPNVERVEYKII